MTRAPALALRPRCFETVAFDIAFPTRGGHDNDVNAGASHCSTAEGIVEDSAVLTGDSPCKVDTEMTAVGPAVPFGARGRGSLSGK